MSFSQASISFNINLLSHFPAKLSLDEHREPRRTRRASPRDFVRGKPDSSKIVLNVLSLASLSLSRPASP